MSRGQKITSRFYKGQFIKPLLGRANPYLYVCLSKAGCKMKRIRLHRIVACAFLPNPDILPVINHKDGNPRNNRMENLEWCSVTYNNTYDDGIHRRMATRMARYPKGTSKSLALKSQATKNIRKCQGAEIPIGQFSPDGQLIKTFPSAVVAGKDLGLWPQNIRNCIYGRIKSSGGFIWKRI